MEEKGHRAVAPKAYGCRSKETAYFNEYGRVGSGAREGRVSEMKETKKVRRKIVIGRWLISLLGIGVVVYLSLVNFGFVTWKELYVQYFNSISLIWMVSVILVVLFIAGAEKDFFKGLRIVFSKPKNVSRMELQRAVRAVGCAEKAAVVSGIVSVAICIIDICYNLHKYIIPEFVAIAVAVTLVNVLYPGIIVLILMPFKVRLDWKMICYMEEPEDAEEERKEADGQRVYFGLRAIGLTDREAEVARLAGEGMSNAEIGRVLYISVATVKKHMTHILEKSGCVDREALREKVKGL